MNLCGRKVLITGAASGIGRATAKLFAEHGAELVLLDRDWAEAGSGMRPSVSEAMHLECNLTQEASVEQAVAQGIEALGQLDGVVNCAGISLRKSVENTSFDEWNAVIDTNLRGPFLVCRAASAALKANAPSTIVNVSSGAAFRPSFDFSAYCASKGGLLMFTRAVALDFAPFGVRVNAVCPGVIDTPMIERAIARSTDPGAAHARFTSNAMSRMGSPEEIANVIMFLTSAESSFVTGAAYSADGGAAYH